MLFTGLTITNWFSLLLQHTFLLAPTNFVRFLDFASKSIETNHHPLYLFILTHLVCVACVRILYLVWHRISSLKHIQNQHLSTLKAAESPNLFYPHSNIVFAWELYFFSPNKKRFVKLVSMIENKKNKIHMMTDEIDQIHNFVNYRVQTL